MSAACLLGAGRKLNALVLHNILVTQADLSRTILTPFFHVLLIYLLSSYLSFFNQLTYDHPEKNNFISIMASMPQRQNKDSWFFPAL